MELAHILEELAYDMGELPREAIEAAIALKEQISPHLLAVLEDAIARVDEVIEHDNYQGHLYAMYLLAQFRDPKAFPLILQLVSFPGELPHAIAGDVLTEDLSRILASVCNGNILPIKQLIENPLINEYVRAAAQTALVNLVGCRQRTRDEVLLYFKELFSGKIERCRSFAWDNLISSSCELYPDLVYPEIRQAFAEQLVDPRFISLEDIGAVLSERKEAHLFHLYQKTELIDDTVSEMEKWLSTSPFPFSGEKSSYDML